MATGNLMTCDPEVRAAHPGIQPEHQTIERKRELNGLAPVFRLFPEILCEILAYVAHESLDDLGSYEWIEVTHVCHQWREIALHSPRLWSHLCLSDHPDFLNELIARSKATPLYVTTGYPVSRAHLDLVLRQLHRIRTLCLDLDTRFPEFTIPSSFSAPELQCLEMMDGYSRGSQIIPLSLEACDLPKLKHLKLKSDTLCLPWTSAIFKSPITHLFLSHKLPPTSTLNETLEALAGMPHLKSVALHDVLPPVLRGPARSVHLPCLEKLDLIDTCKTCSLLLQHVTYPPTMMLYIEFLKPFSKGDVTELGRQIATNLSGPSSSDAGIRSLLVESCCSHFVAAWRKQTLVTEFTPGDPGDANVSLDLTETNTRRFEAILRHVIALLPLSNMHTLYLSEGASFISSWKSLSGAMPNLQELGVSSCHADDQNVLRMLAVRSPKPGLPTPSPIFPHLKVLLLSGMIWRETSHNGASTMLRLLRKMLSSRQTSERMIQELVLKNALHLDQTDLEKLHGVVGKVTWNPDDDSDGESEDYDDEDDDYYSDDDYDEDED